MANRHLARSVALQSLYAWDFRGRRSEALPELVAHTVSECAPELGEVSFVQELVVGVVAKRSELDRVIGKAAPERPLDQITLVDRNILRLGLWELLFGNKEEVPPKVAINEAIELAKTFGSQSSGRFVNGVLGTVYRELAEGDDRGRSSPASREALAGAVVFRKDSERVFLAMAKDAFGYWTLAKGHTEPHETPEQTALRETKEELGVEGKIVLPLGSVSYRARESGKDIQRDVSYYLVETEGTALTLEDSTGLKEARWVPVEEAGSLKHYENQDEIIQKAVTHLTNQESRSKNQG